MHIGKTHKASEFIVRTRRQIYRFLTFGMEPAVRYQVLGLLGLTIPRTVLGLLETATSFIVGLRNVQTYNRTADSQQLSTSILNGSRFWGVGIQSFVAGPAEVRRMVERHVAWSTCLRYELRRPKMAANGISSIVALATQEAN